MNFMACIGESKVANRRGDSPSIISMYSVQHHVSKHFVEQAIGRKAVTTAASRCFASIVNNDKVRLQLEGISPFESRSLYIDINVGCKVGGDVLEYFRDQSTFVR